MQSPSRPAGPRGRTQEDASAWKTFLGAECRAPRDRRDPHGWARAKGFWTLGRGDPGEKGWRLSGERMLWVLLFSVPSLCLYFPTVPRTRLQKRRCGESRGGLHPRDTESPHTLALKTERLSCLLCRPLYYYYGFNSLLSLLLPQSQSGLPRSPAGCLSPDARPLTPREHAPVFR